jgi:ABC-type transport system involved in multi-copper enzyme maturation permease subunit
VNTFRPVSTILKHTLFDEMRQKSFVATCALCLFFVFLLRGCYQGNYVVNGQALSAAAVAGIVSTTVFHAVNVLAMLIVALLSLRLFKRDREAGMQSFILSKPITRTQYVAGKVLGLWTLSIFFTLFLQVAVFFIAAVSAGVVMPGYIVASLVGCLNVLFVILAILLLSLLMSEAAAFLCIVGIGVVGAVTDGFYALSSQTGGASGVSNLSLTRVVSYVWPKLPALEHLASSFIEDGGHRGVLSFYPLFNILLYCVALCVVLLWRFGNEEIS